MITSDENLVERSSYPIFIRSRILFFWNSDVLTDFWYNPYCERLNPRNNRYNEVTQKELKALNQTARFKETKILKFDLWWRMLSMKSVGYNVSMLVTNHISSLTTLRKLVTTKPLFLTRFNTIKQWKKVFYWYSILISSRGFHLV